MLRVISLLKSWNTSRYTLAVLLLCLAGALHAADHVAPDDGIAKGVNPKDNITKFDLIGKYDQYEDEIDIASLALKYDRALGPVFGLNVEVPVIDFKAPGVTEAGLGDILMRVRAVATHGATSMIAGVELVLPTASDDLLGAGKWQINPVVGAVQMFAPTVFGYVGYKHIASVAGDGERDDRNQSQPRALVAYTSHTGSWVLVDAKYTEDWHLDTQELDLDLEIGQMFSQALAASARLGTSLLDSTREFGVGVNLRHLF